ncbi:MAG: HEPN domain-containing protein [bacterium]|nr:HEPN domain-containing protein [bacterium]
MGHIVIEKLLKSFYVKMADENIPYTHNLVMIAKKSNLAMTAEKLSFLADLTTFNINARYDNYKANFKNKCTADYSKKYIKKIEEFRKWLKSEIKK